MGLGVAPPLVCFMGLGDRTFEPRLKAQHQDRHCGCKPLLHHLEAMIFAVDGHPLQHLHGRHLAVASQNMSCVKGQLAPYASFAWHPSAKAKLCMAGRAGAMQQARSNHFPPDAALAPSAEMTGQRPRRSRPHRSHSLRSRRETPERVKITWGHPTSRRVPNSGSPGSKRVSRGRPPVIPFLCHRGVMKYPPKELVHRQT